MSGRAPADYYKQRRTIKNSIERSGIGIHTGSETSIRLEPSEAGEGIYFIRTDLDREMRFPPTVDRVQDYPRATVLAEEGEDLYTVEHLLATFSGLGISDVNVYVDGPEIPALDGSASGFVEAIRDAGIKSFDETRPIYRVQEPLFVQTNDQSMTILPHDQLKISCTISFENEYIGDQFLSCTIDPDLFSEKIAPARTFGFKEEVDELLEKDLVKGGSLKNAIVLDKDGNLIGDEPQYEDEFVRHKILDILGDLSLCGSMFVGHVVAVKNGHFLNVDLARKLSDRVQKSPAAIKSKSKSVDQDGLSVEEIKEILPHRYPMLLVDRVLTIDNDDQFVQGIKNVTMNERFFQGHFPDDPVMPGVLIVEALAQLGAIMILIQPESQSKNSYFMGVDDVKWRRPVRPGDQLLLEVEGKRFRPGAKVGKMAGEAFVEGRKAMEGTFKFALVDG